MQPPLSPPSPRRAAVIIFVAALLACALPVLAQAAALVPIPAGMARIWIYRTLDLNQSLARPYVRLNGAVAGISEPGGAFYRDVPAGEYDVTVDSIGQDVDQWARVAVAPGQQIYVQVDDAPHWDCGGGRRGGWCRDTFYTRLQLPEIGAAAVARLPYTGGA